MSTRSADVLVVGAGHNGLVAACYLARAGYDVEVVERGAAIGGLTTTAAYVKEAPDHLINPCAIDFVFIRASTVIEDLALGRFGYRDMEVDPPYVHLAPDGSSLIMWRDAARTAAEIRRFSVRDARAYLEFAETLDAAMDIVMPFFVTHPTRPAADALRAAARTIARHPGHLARAARVLSVPAAQAIDELFEHPMVRNLLAGCAALVAPITHPGSGLGTAFPGFVHRTGVSRPMGGTGALPAALARCLEHHGGRIRTASPVETITVAGERVTGVRLESGEELAAPTVLASCDPSQTLNRLIEPDVLSGWATARARKIPTGNGSIGHFKADLALSGTLTLPRHQAWRDDDVDLREPAAVVGTLEMMVAAVSNSARGLLPDPMPACAVIPTALDPSQAPAGQDTMYIVADWAPMHPREGWDACKPRAKAAVVGALADFYEGIEALELGASLEGPEDFTRRTGVTGGQIWHVDLVLQRSGPLRPALGFNGYRTPVDGLFLTGGGTHPGPGVSGIPGQLAARTILGCERPRTGSRSGVGAPRPATAVS